MELIPLEAINEAPAQEKPLRLGIRVTAMARSGRLDGLPDPYERQLGSAQAVAAGPLPGMMLATMEEGWLYLSGLGPHKGE